MPESGNPRRAKDLSSTPLGRDRIVRAAVELLDEGGLERCTVRAVAARLECSPMALYRHFDDKAELLSQIPDALMEPVCSDVIRRRTAKTALRSVAVGLADTLRQHPGAAPLFDQPVVGENMAAASQHCIQLLIDEGHPPDRAFPILRAVVAQAIGEAVTFRENMRPVGIELLLTGIERSAQR